MKIVGELAVPVIIGYIFIYALTKKTDIFSAMTTGAKNGLLVIWGIIPALITLLPCIYMLRESGALEVLCWIINPVTSLLGIPSETVPLMLLRPLSGSGALAVAGDIIKTSGADSFVGRCAAVMLGSTETTFYVIAVYFGAAGIKNSRHAIPAALFADLVGFVTAAFVTKLLFGL